jgi:hypothetical protein
MVVECHQSITAKTSQYWTVFVRTEVLLQNTPTRENICHLAAARNNDSMLDHIWVNYPECAAMFRQQSAGKVTPLFKALLSKQKRSIDTFLGKSDLNEPGVLRYTPRHIAAEVGDVEVLDSVFNVLTNAGSRRSPKHQKV